MVPSVMNLMRSRTESLFDKDVKSIRILLSIYESLKKHELLNYFETWFNSSTFPTYTANASKLIEKHFLDVRNMFSNQEKIKIFVSKQEK